MSEIFEKFKKASANQQRQMLKTWDIEYYNNDAPTITDEEYDMCLAFFNNKKGIKNKYVSSLGSANDDSVKFEHPYPVLSLEKIVTKADFLKAAAEFGYNVVIEPKLDGLTIVYYPDGKIVSRGNGQIGEILNADREIPGLPAPYSLPIRLEAVITKSSFEKYFKEDSQKPRNLAAGILRRKLKSQEEIDAIPKGQVAKIATEQKKREKALEDIKHITFYAYNILGADDMSEEQQMSKLKELGFEVPVVQIIKGEAELSAAFDSMEAWSKAQDYDTDGAVIKANVSKREKDFGSTAHHPNNAFAFKFVSMTAETTLKKIRWSLGYDKLTPVAQFDDVVLGGSVVIQASLHNLNIMEQLQVKLGSRISVTLKNEIIPQVIECDGQGDAIETPKFCPACGSTLIINDTKELVCTNPDCKAKFMDTMSRIAGKNGVNIEGMSVEILDAIYRICKRDGLELATPYALLNIDKDVLKKAFDLVHITKTRLVAKRLKALQDEETGQVPNIIEGNLFDDFEEDAILEDIRRDIQLFGLSAIDDDKRVRDIIAEHMEYENFENKVTEADLKDTAAIHERPLAAKLMGEIQKKKKDVLPANFLFSCNVPELGINTAKLILKHFKDLEDFLDNWDAPAVDKDAKPAPKGMTIDGIGDKTYEYIENHKELIRANMGYVESFAPNANYISEEDKEKDAAKLKFCISGKLSKPKSYYEKLILESGNTYLTSVTKDLDYLVSLEKGTSKVVKAQKYGIQVLDEAGLMELLKSL